MMIVIASTINISISHVKLHKSKNGSKNVNMCHNTVLSHCFRIHRCSVIVFCSDSMTYVFNDAWSPPLWRSQAGRLILFHLQCQESADLLQCSISTV